MKNEKNNDLDFKSNLIFTLVQSLFIELSLHPKPGLITPIELNSHNDMDFFLMLDSIKILQKYFLEFYTFVETRVDDYLRKELQSINYNIIENRLNNIKNMQTNLKFKFKFKFKFKIKVKDKDKDNDNDNDNDNNIYNNNDNNNIKNKLQKMINTFINNNYEDFLKKAIYWEKKLFKFTNGVNTYKGIIFSFSIFIITFILYLKLDLLSENPIHKILLENERNNFKSPDLNLFYFLNKIVGSKIVAFKKENGDSVKLTYGSILRKQKIEGEIFSIAASGYKICFNTAEYIYNLMNSLNQIIKNSNISYTKIYNYKKAIFLKGFCNIGKQILDSNIAGKKNTDLNTKYNQLCEHIIDISFFKYKKIYKKINSINKFCIRNKISPGGTADLLAYSIALYKLLF